MRRQRRIKKEDIGDPSNFVHVKHVGFGQNAPSMSVQKSSDSYANRDSSQTADETSENATGETEEETYQVERRNKGHRSQIPRHHRSTTTCIFPSENPYALSRGHNNKATNSNEITHRESLDSPPGVQNKSSLKPTFGSLLNLSFLPLGLGKTSSKSPSIGKTKRMSLLNLTSGNLFASPKPNYAENPEAVHMTSYVRRRSLSGSNDENNGEEGETRRVSDKSAQNAVGVKDDSKLKSRDSIPIKPTRIPLAKLGRSKSTMSDFSKRPKLRLKIVPPPQPPPVPPVAMVKNISESETLPCPPPSPIPSPPPSPVPATPTLLEEVAVLRSPKSTPRPRIIPLPSTSSVDSAEPSSPQYLTPAGGSSPVPTNESSLPLLLSPTIPPSSTPFFSPSRSGPGTPPVWPLQPVWPTTILMQSKEPSIPEIPSPCKEEMETSENEYGPVLSIVESFISSDHASAMEGTVDDTEDTERQERRESSHNQQPVAVTASNISSISSILREHVEFIHWPRIAEKLFHTVSITSPNQSNDQVPSSSVHEKDVYLCLLTKTLELWLAKVGDEANVEKLLAILQEDNHHQATDSLEDLLQGFKM